MLKNINAVIFDMDGVIFDSERVYYDAFFMAADKLEIEASHEFVLSFVGKSSKDCLLILNDFFNNNIERSQKFFHQWKQSRLDILANHGLEFKDGFLILFSAIKQSGKKIGLVTSAYYEDLRINFAKNNNKLLNEFTHIITLEDVKFPKPDPQPYNMMIRHLGQKPEECLVIEDSISGIISAINAGANTIMINEHIEPPANIADKLYYKTDHHDNILTFLQSNGHIK